MLLEKKTYRANRRALCDTMQINKQAIKQQSMYEED